MTVLDRISNPGPKKLLALDGGGIRGLISIEILAEIERLLRETLRRDDSFVLADYFDYVAGTSTGAIIAACISLGMSIDKIRHFYTESGKDMFDKAWLLDRFLYKYEDDRLAARLRQALGWDTTLGSANLRTLLLMIMRNATTDSPWCISNNPNAKYNRPGRGDSNLDLPLWQLVRASTAAPSFFPPETIRIGNNRFIFVDGGLTSYNNPAFQLFLMATVEPFHLNWPTGEDRLLLVSVGTGKNAQTNPGLQPHQMNLLYDATTIPSGLMYAALNEQDLLCRVFGKCLAGEPLDREAGNLIGAAGPVNPKLFTYLRYDTELSQPALEDLGLPGIKPQTVQQLDSIEHLDDLQRIGAAVARQIQKEPFGPFLTADG